MAPYPVIACRHENSFLRATDHRRRAIFICIPSNVMQRAGNHEHGISGATYTSPVDVMGEVVMPRAAGYSGFTGEVYLALEGRYMTAADQGRRIRRP